MINNSLISMRWAILVVTIISLSCVLFNGNAQPERISIRDIISEWVDNYIYFISYHNGYALRKYNVLTNNTDIITYLSSDTSVAFFIVSPIDTCIFFIRQPVSFSSRIELNYAFGYEPAIRQNLETTSFSTYYPDKRLFKYETTFSKECRKAIHDPLYNALILNIYSVADLKEINTNERKDVKYRNDFVVYNYNIKTKIASPLENNSYALGFLPDSTLLLHKVINGKWCLYIYDKNQSLKYLKPLEINIQPLSRKTNLCLLPYSNTVVWFEEPFYMRIHTYNIVSNKKDTIIALSSSYCFSPDRKKIAFFVEDRKTHELKIEIIPVDIE
jgi:hypothetical protein